MNDVVVTVLESELEENFQLFASLPLNVQQFKAAQSLYGKVRAAQQSLTFIEKIKMSTFQPRHWGTLFSRISGELQSTSCNPNLEELHELKLFLHADFVEELIDQVGREREIEKVCPNKSINPIT